MYVMGPQWEQYSERECMNEGLLDKNTASCYLH